MLQTSPNNRACSDPVPKQRVSVAMLMSSNTSRPARLHYMANGFRVLTSGDHVVCASSGAKIPLDALRYWSVASQEAYASAEIATEAMAGR